MVIYKRAVDIEVPTINSYVTSHRFGTPHMTLVDTPTWLDIDERPSADAAILADARRAGILDRRDRVDSDFLDLLTLLGSGAQTEFYGWITEGRYTRSVLAAASGSLAVIAVRSGNKVQMKGIPADGLVDMLVGQLPHRRPGGGGTFNIPLADITGESPTQRRGYTDSGVPRATGLDFTYYQNLRTHRQLASAELYTAVRTTAGRRQSVYPLRVVDIQLGRWFLHQVGDNVVGAPADHAVLAQRLTEMHNQLLNRRSGSY